MRRGQATLEYFIFFAVMSIMVMATLMAYSKGNKQNALENYITGGTGTGTGTGTGGTTACDNCNAANAGCTSDCLDCTAACAR
jgi:hypothetical protein